MVLDTEVIIFMNQGVPVRQRRIISQIKDFIESEEIVKDYFTCQVDPQAYHHLTGVIFGPRDTPYEKGQFAFEIYYPEDYPYQVPSVVFNTKILHPNIDILGRPCMDILTQQQWSPALTLRSTIVSLVSLLSEPNPNDAVNEEAAALLKTDKNAFMQTAKEWTQKYANKKINQQPPFQYLPLKKEK